MKNWNTDLIKILEIELLDYQKQINHYENLLQIHGEVEYFRAQLELNETLYRLTVEQIKDLNKSNLRILFEIIISNIKNIFKK